MHSYVLGCLVTSLNNCDKRCFKDDLEDISDLGELEESDGFNIFHYFAVIHVNENIVLEFFQILYQELIKKFKKELIELLMDSKTTRENQATALQTAIFSNKSVNPN